MSTPVNIQPILDLIGHAGELTSEFKQAKATGRFAIVMWIASLIIMVLGLTQTVLPGSHLAAVLGAVGMALGVVVQALSGAHFSAGRQNLKANAGVALQVLAKAAGSGALILQTDSGTIPAAKPAVAVAVVETK